MGGCGSPDPQPLFLIEKTFETRAWGVGFVV
jgi:hypothetical protein